MSYSDRDSQADSDVPARSLSLTDLALQKLTAKLKLFTDADTLTLADCFIGDSGCGIVAKFVKEHPAITSVDLRGNNIGEEGLKAVAAMIRSPTSVVSLSLEWNNGHLGLEAIADALSTNSTLRYLDLRNNKVGPAGAAQLARGLGGNKTLQRLDLRWNELGLEGVRPFISLLETGQCSLQQLELSGNKAPEDAVKKIENLLKGEKGDSREENGAASTPRRRLADTYSSHGRNRSSGSYRRREAEVPPLTHTRLETQIADLEFALEQERKRNSDLASALASAQTLQNDAEAKIAALQTQLEEDHLALEAERNDTDSAVAEERRQKEECLKEIARLQELYARQQALTQSQVKDVESRLVELQKVLARTEDDLSAALAYKERRQNESLESLRGELDAKIKSKDEEIASLVDLREKLTAENRVLRGQLVQTQEQSKQSLAALQVQMREDETRRFNATFHAIDQKLKTVQELRDSLLEKSQDLQRELMKTEKKSVEQSLAFDLERAKLQDQVRDLTSQLRELQSDYKDSASNCEGFRLTCSKLDNENQDLRRSLEDQSASFQRTLGQMMSDQRGEREQWDQQRSSTLHRIQVLEGELLIHQSEKRRALDEYVSSTQSSLAADLKVGIARTVQDAVKAHLAGLEAADS